MTREEETLQKATAYATEAVGYNDDGTERTQVIEPMRDTFIDGAKWADQTLIDKAVKWLEYNFNLPSDFEGHFRKAMK